MEIEIFTHGGGVVLYYIFNAVASITSGSSFVDLITMTVALAAIWIGFKSAFNLSSVKENAIWFGAYLVLYNGLLLPKVTVLITDKLDSTYVATVDNVPYGLAMIGGYTSAIGNGMAELFDQAFALPNDQNYSETGFLFGNKVLRDASKLKISDREFSSNMSEFVNQCMFYDIETANKYTYNDLFETGDIWSFLTEENTPSSVWMFDYKTNGTTQTVTCDEGAKLLESKWYDEIEDRTQYLYEKNFGKSDTNATAVGYMASYLQDSNDFLMGMSEDSSKIVRQHLMINAINTAVDVNSEYADIIAELERKETYARTASIAQKSVVILRSVLEAIFYGIFPFIFLLFILPGGIKVFIGYIKGFLWIQLWPVLYAILHLVLSLKNKTDLEFASGTVNFLHYEAVDLITEDISIMAGYMMLSIPPIAWALVTGMQSMGYAVGNFLSASAASAQSAAAEKTRGNYSLGNSSFDNHSYNNTSANKTDTSALSKEHGLEHHGKDGIIRTTHGDGHQTIDTTNAKSKLNAEFASSYNMQSAFSDAASESKSMGDNLNKEAMSSLSSSFETASRMAHQFNEAKERGETWTENVDTSTHKAFDSINNMSSKTNAHAGVGVDKFGVSAGVSKEWSKEEQAQIRESLDVINRSSKSGQINFQDSESNSLNEELNSSMTEYKQLSDKAETFYNQSENLTKEARRTEELGISYNKDLTSEFHKFLREDKKYDEAEATSLIEDKDRIQTTDILFKEFMRDTMDDMYSDKYGNELMETGNNINEMSYSARSSEFDEKHSSMIQNRNNEIKNSYDSAIKENGVEIDQGNLEKRVDIAVKNNELKYDLEKSGSSISAKTGDALLAAKKPVIKAATPESPKFDLNNPTLLEVQGFKKRREENDD